ncbi:MAG: nitronate monooxygenase [Methylocystaceae bacterium]|nr:nitronate monooxygenase [Methylocystaceae bacterium]
MADPALFPHSFLTDRFGLRLPVLAGGLMWLADADYVSACARAGILGFITAASFPDLDDLRAEIKKCRELSDGKPFGVNISMLPKLVEGEKTTDIFQLIIDEGVEVVETSGRNPEAYLPMLKAANICVIHKVPALKYALKAQAIGVDAVSIVGAECGGHPGEEMIGSMVNTVLGLERLSIPYFIGGGIGHGAQIPAALAMGASGVVIGTRFLSATEIWAHDGYKQSLIDANEGDTALVMGSIRNTVRALRNQTTNQVQKIEREESDITIETLLPYVSGQIGKQAYETGDTRLGLLSAGQTLGLIDKIEPLSEIVDRLYTQAREALLRLKEATS